MTLITKDIQKAVAALNKGQVIAIPTETVYGLAANIYDDNAVNSIFEIKIIMYHFFTIYLLIVIFFSLKFDFIYGY